jgi:RimJ/RimL family protein N-acetyltransferase
VGRSTSGSASRSPGSRDREERLLHPADARGIAAALADGFRYEGARRLLDGPRLVLAHLPGDQPVERFFPDLPDGQLTDGVVVLRPHRPDDLGALWGTFTDPLSRRFALAAPSTRAEFDAGIAASPGTWLLGTDAKCTVLDAATGAVAGDATVHLLSAQLGNLNLGYATHPAWRGRGVAGRAAVLLSTWAATLPGVHRIEAGANVDNAASLRVLERAGFVREGVQHRLLPSPDGSRQDVVTYWWPDQM